MKRKIGLWLLTLLAFAFIVYGLTGCAGGTPAKDPFLTTSYQTLSVMHSSYDLTWSSFVKLYKDGLVKEETFQAGRKLAIVYFDNWTKAANYLKKYSQGTLPAGGFDALKKLTEISLEALKEYLKKESGGIKPII